MSNASQSLPQTLWSPSWESILMRKNIPRSATATSSSSFASVASPGNKSPRNKGQNSAGNSPARPDIALVDEVNEQRSMVLNQEGTSGSAVMADSGACGGYLKEDKEKSDMALLETASFINQLPPAMFGVSEWDDTDSKILAQVLAASQQEYLDCLKRTAKETPTNADDIKVILIETGEPNLEWIAPYTKRLT
uniref:Uncharacterized protein n=1 Tax=Strigamia maritima TaxID=126957 RepID=T1II52_STRMM